jgi:hypothetical protein
LDLAALAGLGLGRVVVRAGGGAALGEVDRALRLVEHLPHRGGLRVGVGKVDDGGSLREVRLGEVEQRGGTPALR